MTTIDDLIRDLLAAAPELDAMLQEHLVGNDELLAHVFFGDLTRWLVAREPVQAVLDVLEEHLNEGDASVENLIGASFLENVAGDEPGERAIQAALPPHLKA